MRTFAISMAAVLALSAATEATARDGLDVGFAEPLGNLEIRTMSRSASAESSTSMRFDALGRRFELGLSPNTALVSPEARATIDALGKRIEVYRGRLNDDPSTWARIVVTDGVPSGMIYDGEELYAIEAPTDAVHGENDAAIFRLADLQVAPGTMSCGTSDVAASNGAQLYDNIVADIRTAMQRGPGAVEELEIGAMGDAAFAGNHVDPAQAILTRLNNVDGIYSSELGIQITVPLVDIFDATTDPFSATTDPGTLLDELSTVRNGNAAQNALGLSHLFTGRNLDGTTVGIAFLNVVCSQQFGAALTQGDAGPTTDALVAAHEIGHNFGADHDGDPAGSCPNEPNNLFIMAEVTNGNPAFSDCSKNVMLANAAQAACIVPLSAVDVTVNSFGEAETIFLGNALTLTFGIQNRGAIDATNVAVDIALPTNVTLISAATPSAPCVSGAGTVSCPVGTLAGSSGTTVTLVASTDTVGDAAFTATVTADTDDRPLNNSDTHVVSVLPAVDLVASTPSPASVRVDGTVTVAVAIDNVSTLDANNVTATVTVDPGLSAASASWTAGSCAVSNSTVACTATSLAAAATSTLTLGITGLQAGTRGYTVQVNATEDDANTADNLVSGSVSVIGASGSSDEGGGAAGLLWLFGLAVLAVRRRHHRA